MPFFILFVCIPLIELMVFMAVGEKIGLFTTLLLALLTAILGGALVKHQGLQVLGEIRKAMARGQMPLGELFDGFCLVAAGAMLITPGFVTDTIGFLLLVPPVRTAIRQTIQNHTSWHVSGGGTQKSSHSQTPPDVIEGDYERVDED